LNERTYLPGQRFHMDMGFVRGSRQIAPWVI
jgi:hypothetical protein